MISGAGCHQECCQQQKQQLQPGDLQAAGNVWLLLWRSLLSVPSAEVGHHVGWGTYTGQHHMLQGWQQAWLPGVTCWLAGTVDNAHLHDFSWPQQNFKEELQAAATAASSCNMIPCDLTELGIQALCQWSVFVYEFINHEMCFHSRSDRPSCLTRVWLSCLFKSVVTSVPLLR